MSAIMFFPHAAAGADGRWLDLPDPALFAERLAALPPLLWILVGAPLAALALGAAAAALVLFTLTGDR